MKSAVGPDRRREASPARGRIGMRRAILVAAIVAACPAGAMETSILISPAPAPGAETGYTVALDGTDIAIGAPGENAVTGAIYAVNCATLPCTAPLRIAPVDIVAGDTFGAAVSVSGDTMAATAPGPEPGAAYVYIRDGAGWTQQARLTPSGGSTGERFGISASLSGDRLAVGADRANGRAGAVYVFVRSGASWTQEARLTASDPVPRDALGSSVSLDADTLLAGAPMKRNGTTGSYANGVAYVFTRDAGGWTQQAKLSNASSANGDLFGFSVDVAGDRVVIGAPYATSAQGLAYVFTRSAGVWSQQAQLAASAGAAGDEFGWSVALGDDSILVGAPFAGQLADAPCGGSYVFDGALLTQTGVGSIEAPLLNEMSGWSIAASGTRWIGGAPGHIVGVDDHAGAAYWFDPTVTLFHAGFDLSGACVAAVEPGG
jgi:hypothetical protein